MFRMTFRQAAMYALELEALGFTIIDIKRLKAPDPYTPQAPDEWTVFAQDWHKKYRDGYPTVDTICDLYHRAPQPKDHGERMDPHGRWREYVHSPASYRRRLSHTRRPI
jgi:hypothetical protein